MEKHIIPTSYRFGSNRVEIMPYFLYEVSIYKITKNMVCLVDSCFYKSDKLLKIKKDTTIIKHLNYSIVRFINILGVTEEFVEDNLLPIYENKSKKKTLKNNKK